MNKNNIYSELNDAINAGNYQLLNTILNNNIIDPLLMQIYIKESLKNSDMSLLNFLLQKYDHKNDFYFRELIKHLLDMEKIKYLIDNHIQFIYNYYDIFLFEIGRRAMIDIFEYINNNCDNYPNNILYFVNGAIYNHNLDLIVYAINNHKVDISKILEKFVDNVWIDGIKFILENYDIRLNFYYEKNNDIFLLDDNRLFSIILEYEDIDHYQVFRKCVEYSSIKIVNILIDNYDFENDFILEMFKNSFDNKNMDMCKLLVDKFGIKFTIDFNTFC